jgi:hypothetical protein
MFFRHVYKVEGIFVFYRQNRLFPDSIRQGFIKICLPQKVFFISLVFYCSSTERTGTIDRPHPPSVATGHGEDGGFDFLLRHAFFNECINGHSMYTQYTSDSAF